MRYPSEESKKVFPKQDIEYITKLVRQLKEKNPEKSLEELIKMARKSIKTSSKNKFNFILKLAKNFEHQVLENDLDLEGHLDPDVVVEEHKGVEPVSYMAFSNLKNLVHDSTELLSIMNEEDDLPQWADELLAVSKNNVNKALSYVRSEKTVLNSKNEKHDEDELAELEKDVKLISEAGIMSSFLGLFDKSPEMNKLRKVDDSLKEIASSYGPGKLSLEKRVLLAKENLSKQRFQEVIKHISMFNEALSKMAEAAFELKDHPYVKKAGFFDFFKSKKEEVPVQEIQDPKALAAANRECFRLVKDAENALEVITGRDGLLNSLNKHRSEGDFNQYVKELNLLFDIQEYFNSKFEKARNSWFKLLPERFSDVWSKTIKEMSEEAKMPSQQRESEKHYIAWQKDMDERRAEEERKRIEEEERRLREERAELARQKQEESEARKRTYLEILDLIRKNPGAYGVRSA